MLTVEGQCLGAALQVKGWQSYHRAMRLLSGTLLTLGLTVALAHAALALDAPTPFTAVYALSQGAISFGTMERKFEVDADGAYRYTSRMEASGVFSLVRSDSIVEASSGVLQDGEFRPEHYDYRNSRGNKHYTLRFDYPQARVLRSDQPKGWQAAMPPGLKDKLVYQLQMMVDLAAAPEALRYAVADKNKLKDYRFAVRGEEKVKTGKGRYRALRLEKGDGPGERRTVVWCARELGWLPVKVEYHEKDGGVTTAVLRAFEQPRR